MHILITNDDGPPSNQSSPYIHSFVKALQSASHTVSVILPHTQRSWIGKAHIVGQLTKPTYFRPGNLHQDDGTTHEKPLVEHEDGEEWVLVDGTPATCAQLGLHHFFQDRGPVDLVISGPNYGRNSTSLFSLSSGTIGGAMEAAVCRKKAIALSYAFYSRDHDPELIAGASRHSVRLIEHLYHNWGRDVDVYTINVPLIEDVENHKIMYTNALQNYWSSGSSFTEVEPTENGIDAQIHEKDIRQDSEASNEDKMQRAHPRHKHRHFKWTPKFTDVHKSIQESPPGNDGWALEQGFTSVTPLKANFMHASSLAQGELKLAENPMSMSSPFDRNEMLNSISPAKTLQEETSTASGTTVVYALIDYEDPYVQPLILRALKSQLHLRYVLVKSVSELPDPSCPFLQISPYETLGFDHLLNHPSTSMANSFIIRKALIRKHYLANTISFWLSKEPGSPLKYHVKPTLNIELDYAEFLDEALLEAYELHQSFSCNADKEPKDREWWILKPSMSDRGQGIRLFSTEDELRTIFEGWEAEEFSSNSDSSDEPEAVAQASTNIITSQLRHFILQTYITPPLLLPEYQNRKFHIRSYVLSVGALKVYIYNEMLALFAPLPYTPPGQASSTTLDPLDPRIHLTNTCLHTSSPLAPTVALFSTLPLPISQTRILSQIHETTAALFTAAARTQVTNFQPLPNAFEIYGVDWLVDAEGTVWLLEVNAFPDFAQTGERLRGVVEGLWKGVLEVAVKEFFGANDSELGGQRVVEDLGMTCVLDLDLGRR